MNSPLQCLTRAAVGATLSVVVLCLSTTYSLQSHLEKILKKKSRSRPIRRRGISRIDQPSTRTHGWFVRAGFHTRADGTSAPRHRKFFGDVGYGGKRKSLKAATAYLAIVTRVRRKRVRTARRAAA